MIWMQAEARKADSMSTNSVTTITIVISRRRLWPYRLWEVICITIAPQTPHVKNTSRAAITHTYTFSVLLAIHHLQVIFTAPPPMNSCLSIISIFFFLDEHILVVQQTTVIRVGLNAERIYLIVESCWNAATFLGTTIYLELIIVIYCVPFLSVRVKRQTF